MRLLAKLPIRERSQAAESRRIAVQFAKSIGFNEERTGRVAVVATELANNLVSHAQQGEILLSTFQDSLELLAMDRGPGMNLLACMEDGYSSGGTAGAGLGAAKRMSDRFDAHTDSAGTVIAAGFGRSLPIGVARAPIKDETACGDDWSLVERGDTLWLMVADGLGHGEFAAEASRLAVDVFETGRFESPAAVLEEIHAGLRSTRGAAVSVAEIQASMVNYCGLGNIAGIILADGTPTHMVSLPGTAGAQAPRIRQFSYACPPGAVLVMHSDGLQSQWSLDRYPAVLRRSPGVMAALLYRDFSRGRDDVTVSVVRR